MSVLILKPENCEEAYIHATETFQKIYFQITGINLPVGDSDDLRSDLFVIGSDSVNDFVTHEFLEGHIKGLDIRYGTDDYCILSYTENDRRIVIIAGGCGRSTIYAVYDFFERFAGCSYFWDGDIIPKKNSIRLGDFKILESPRFEYRGLRYFAHRGLKRFQAEHWSYEDWKKELDWMMKKRLNFFMLRIGMDDVWQRAFPDVVKYPEEFQTITDEKGYNDRSDFWTLEYRGKLREKVLEYARKLELIYPTDCGLMTHWYSRTPKEFLKKQKPEFINQSSGGYMECDTGKVWDFLIQENMDNYMHLTKTMVKEYEKRADYFHTIGLGERIVSPDKKKNHRLKLVAYRKTLQNLRKNYPNSKTFIASWDFVGWWEKQEVQALIKELDPERTIILDYTSEVNDSELSFINWNVVNNFPWVFGLFHAYESENELRGPYERTANRLKIAAEDPYCKGMILWPELSHSDIIVLEYLSENAWSPLKNTIEELVTNFCKKRYGDNWEFMNSCWQGFLPFMMLADWGGFSKRDENDPLHIEYYSATATTGDMWTRPRAVLGFKEDMSYKRHIELKITKAMQELPQVIIVINSLGHAGSMWEDTFFKRDAIDIIRTVIGRFLNFLLVSALYENDVNKLSIKKEIYFQLFDLLRDLLCKNDDFSLYKTLNSLKATAPTNPDFERTLKENICDGYCRQAACELMDEVLKKEAACIFDYITNGFKKEDSEQIGKKMDAIINRFFEIPLVELVPSESKEISEICKCVAECLENLTKVL